jgi:hypothetical protein
MIFLMVAFPKQSITESCRGGALVLGLVIGLAACQTAPGPAVDPAPFVRTTRGDDVRSQAPPGVEVTLGSKRLRPAGAPPDPE